jgi:hypothetical protein
MNVINVVDNDLWLQADASRKWFLVKLYRDEFLARCHWTLLPDAILTVSEKLTWQTYRETLQNLEFAFVNPDDVDFPDAPISTSTMQTPAIVSARARLKASRITAKAIPNWATWTQSEWDTYFAANLSTTLINAVSTTAQIRVMMNKQNLIIQNLVKLVITMRDETWPDL